MKKVTIHIVLLLTSLVSFGMENHGDCSQTTIPCVEKEKPYYVDYIVIQRYFAGQKNEVAIPFICLKKTEEQAVIDLNKSNNTSLDSLPCPCKASVSLLRMYKDPKESRHVQNLYNNKESDEIIKKKLLELCAEEGNWTIEEAITKIKLTVGIQ